MAQISTIFIVVACALAFWVFVPLLRLFQALPQIVTALSIIAAALFVRLNRGLPTIDWKSIAPDVRKRLTCQMEDIVREYVIILAIAAALTGLLVAIEVLGPDFIKSAWLEVTQRAVAAIVGGLIALSVLRMSYVVWRDYDIVKTQRKAIDAATDAEHAQRETRSAENKIAAIKGAGLRAVRLPEAEGWDD